MNFLDPNKPYTISIEAYDSDEDKLPNANISIEVCDSDEDELPNANISIEICDSDEDELPNANISEKYVEAPGLPDLNFVSPIQNNIFKRQDIDNQEKNNLNNTVSSSSPVKSIQNTKESVTIVEHNSNNTSDDEKHEAEMESLNKVSNNLLNIIEMDGRMAEKNHLSNREIDRIKKLFLSMKYHHFSLSYDIVISLFLPRLSDKNFITNFCDYTVNNSRVNRTFDCSHKTIKTLFWEMIKWTKYKKGQIDFHENIKRMEQNDQNNKPCVVNGNVNLVQQNVSKIDTKSKIETKTPKNITNATADVTKIPQLCPNSDQIENNESEVVINRNTIYDNSNMSIQRNEILPEERCISSTLPAVQEVGINVQTKNNVNQETVSPQTCLQNCCQNTTSQYSSDNETVSQSNSNMYTPHLENATISKSPHVVILPPNYDKEQPNMNLTLQSNIFINQSKTPLHKNTSNHSNNQYQPSFSINTVINPDNQYQLALHDNIARNPSYHPQASLHRNTSNNSNIQYQPSLLENTVNPDIQYQLALHDYIARNPSYHPEASLHRNISNNSNIQYQPSFFQNTVVNPDNQYHLTLHDNNGINQNNRLHASLHINNYHNSNNQYRPSLHRNSVVNPNTNHNVPIIRDPRFGIKPNYQQSSRRYVRNTVNQNLAPIYRPNGINAINPNPPPIYRPNGINAINPNPPPIYRPNGINAINPNPPPIYRPNGINAINPNPPPIYRPNGINAINPNPAPIYRPNGIIAINSDPPPIYRPNGINAINSDPLPIYRPNGINAINSDPPPIYRPNGINAINSDPPPIYRPNGINAINSDPPPIYRPNGINAINSDPLPIYRPNGINAINQYQPINQRHDGVNPIIQHQPSLHTTSDRVPNIQYPPKLQHKRKNYQPRKTGQQITGQMNNSNTSSSTTSSAESSEYPNALSPANTQNEENTSHQPQEAIEQCTPIIAHVRSLNKKCYVCGSETAAVRRTQRYCSEKCQALDRLNHFQ